MRSKKRPFFWLFVLFLIQNSVHTVFLQNTPPFLLIGVIFYALSEGAAYGVLVGCFAGLFLEIFGVGKIGYQMAVLGITGGLVGFLSSQIFRESFLTQFLLPSLANYFVTLLNLLITKSVLSEDIWSAGIFQEAFSFSSFFLTSIFTPIVFYFLKSFPEAGRSRLSVWR